MPDVTEFTLANNPAALSLLGPTEIIVTINRDGTVEVNPKYTVDEAARAFWEAVERLNPR